MALPLGQPEKPVGEGGGEDRKKSDHHHHRSGELDAGSLSFDSPQDPCGRLVRRDDKGHGIGVPSGHFRGHKARVDKAQGDSVRGERESERVRPGHESGLGGAIGSGFGKAAISGQAPHHRNLSLPGRAHRRQEGKDRVEDSEDVGSEDLFHGFAAVAVSLSPDAGIGDEKIGRRAFVQHRLGHLLQSIGIPDVGDVEPGGRPFGPEAFFQGLEPLPSSGHEVEGGPGGGEAEGQSLADPRGGAGDDDDGHGGSVLSKRGGPEPEGPFSRLYQEQGTDPRLSMEMPALFGYSRGADRCF